MSDVAEGVTGKDIITGEEVGGCERALTIGACLIPGIGFVDDFKDASKIGKLFKTGNKGGDKDGDAKSAQKICKKGPYSHLEEPKNTGPGKRFTKKQKKQIKEENKKRNGGRLKSDESGKELVEPKKHKKGKTPPDNEAHIHHVKPKSKGGSNNNDNARVLSREENLRKGANE